MRKAAAKVRISEQKTKENSRFLCFFERKCLLAKRKEHLGTLRGEARGKPTEGRILARVNEIDIPRLVIKNLHFFWLFKEKVLTLQQIYKFF